MNTPGLSVPPAYCIFAYLICNCTRFSFLFSLVMCLTLLAGYCISSSAAHVHRYKTRPPQRHHITCLRSAAAFSVINPTCCMWQRGNQLPHSCRTGFLFCVWVFSSRHSSHYNIHFFFFFQKQIGRPRGWCTDALTVYGSSSAMIYLIMVPFLWAHLITPVKDRANTHCVWELQLQQSYALDVMCMQPCVWSIWGIQSSGLSMWWRAQSWVLWMDENTFYRVIMHWW